jgi:hypothetical protein
MFNKYFDLVNGLFDAVFKGGEAVRVTDYLTLIGWTLALIGIFIASVAVLFFIVKGPMIIYGKLVSKIKNTIKEIDNAIANQCFDKYPKETIETKYKELNSKLIKRNLLFAGLIIFLYIPIVIPTLLFIASNVLSWF